MIRVLLALGFCVSLATSASAAKCPFIVDEIREPRKGEAFDEDITRDRNTAVGPNHLVAHIEIVNRRGYLVVSNSETGEDSLFVRPSANLPEWSPDGRYLSVYQWTEQFRMGKLVVFDSKTWKTVVDVGLSPGANAKWSPDSKRIASASSSYDEPVMLVYSVAVPEGKVTKIDTSTIPGDIELSWSPDSRWIVYSKPTKVHHVGDTMVSELMLGDVRTGEAWTLIPATDHNQSNPLWIHDHTVQIDRLWWKEDDTDREQRVVVVLKPVP